MSSTSAIGTSIYGAGGGRGSGWEGPASPAGAASLDGPAPWVEGPGSAVKWSGTARPLSWCHATDAAGSVGGEGCRVAATSQSSWLAVIVGVLDLVRARLVARVAAFFIFCCPLVAAELYALLVRWRATYASIRGTRSGVSPP
jgi:hypothetical protein